MRYKTRPLFLFLLLPVLWACDPSANREQEKAGRTGREQYAVIPDPQTPGEALRLLAEGNARHVHQERGWWRLSNTADQPPLAVLLNAGVGDLDIASVFDLPANRLPLVNWTSNTDAWRLLDQYLEKGVKLVIVLLPYREAAWPDMLSTTETSSGRLLQQIQQQATKKSVRLLPALERGQCQFLGAMFHPIHQRLILLPAK